jgi:cell cycle checkpoint protein
MDQPPAKRQRRLTIPESDESDFENEEPNPKAPKTRASAKKAASKPKSDVNSKNPTSAKPTTKPKAKSNGQLARKTSQSSSKATTPASSPEKKRSKGTLDTDGAKSKSLLSFFGKASDQQRWDRKPGVGTPLASGELDDDIEDDSLDEAELLKLPDPTQNHKTVLDRRKTTNPEPRRNGIGSRPDSITSASQKFMKPPSVLRKASSGSSKPWTDEYAPTNLAELGVHKKKVMDVQTWLEDVFAGRDRRVRNLYSIYVFMVSDYS